VGEGSIGKSVDARAYPHSVKSLSLLALNSRDAPKLSICQRRGIASDIRISIPLDRKIRGLLWENYSGQTLRVTQSIWNSHVNTPKTPASQDDVPVIPALKTKLDLWRLRSGNPTAGLMFPSSAGTPIELNNVLNRVILPALKKARMPWYGYHAFRRGLATNLHDAGVNDLTIQRILRHSDVSVTRRAYIKRLPQQATDAMEKIQSAMEKAAAEEATNVN